MSHDALRCAGRLVAHGSPGEIRVTKTLSITSASLFTQEVSLFMRSLVALLEPAAAEPSARAGRLDLLGCNVAFGEEGARLIDELESLYKVNVAASDDVTAAIRPRPFCCGQCGANDMERESDMILETDGVDAVQVRSAVS